MQAPKENTDQKNILLVSADYVQMKSLLVAMKHFSMSAAHPFTLHAQDSVDNVKVAISSRKPDAVVLHAAGLRGPETARLTVEDRLNHIVEIASHAKRFNVPVILIDRDIVPMHLRRLETLGVKCLDTRENNLADQAYNIAIASGAEKVRRNIAV